MKRLERDLEWADLVLVGNKIVHRPREARFKAFLVGIETPAESALKAAQKPRNIGYSIPEAVDRIYTKAGATVH